MTLVLKTTHVTQALANLVNQFQGQPVLEALIRSYIEEIQEIEDALFVLMLSRYIDNAEGVQLDAIGTVVGQLRLGLTDIEYRIALRTRVLINKTGGTPNEIIEIMDRALPGNTTFAEYFPAAFTVKYDEVDIDSNVVSRLKEILLLIKSSGVLAQLHYSPSTAFAFDTPSRGFDESKWGSTI